MSNAHRFWRVRSPNTAVAGEYMGCTELELRATPSGADETGSGTASASATHSSGFAASKAFDNNGSTFWTTGVNTQPSGGHWLQYDFGSGVTKEIQEVSYTARSDAVREDPLDIYIEWSDDGAHWFEKWSVLGMAAWTASEVRVWTDPFIGTVATDGGFTGGFVRTLSGDGTPELKAGDLRSRVIYSYPAQEGWAASVATRALWGDSGGVDARANSLIARILIKFGRDVRQLRAWTFTQDDHDFYVLQLGSLGSLVYDKLTNQWAQWRSPGFAYYRGNDAVAWEGWNIACDTESGKLWIIDPEGRLDEETTPIVSQAVGGITVRARKNVACYDAELAISEGEPPLGFDDGSVGLQLRTSTDDGKSWVNHGTVDGTGIGEDLVARWYGLGLMQSSGMIFEITNTGYARRLDGLTASVELDDDSGPNNG
jgi:hypothetical protein